MMFEGVSEYSICGSLMIFRMSSTELVLGHLDVDFGGAALVAIDVLGSFGQ
jgi:hypothetical protein